MVIAILATGDEIVHGDTLNTNAQAIAKALSSEGIPLGLHMSCSDKEQDLYDSINYLAHKHEIIFIIGGLGPTSDDRTRFALARSLGATLIVHPEAVEHIEARLIRANLPVDTGNQQQALFPENTQLLPNPNGTAMGCICASKDKLYILLPGPPRECLPMLNNHVLPFLQNKSHSAKKILTWMLFGAPEGSTAQLLDKSLESVDCDTGYRLDMPYLEFKVRCLPCFELDVRKIVEPLVAPYIISPPKIKASMQLRDLIARLKLPISIIDKATGGHLQVLLQRPGNTNNVYFHETSESTICFYLSGLQAYWANLQDIKTELIIQYGDNKETHQIPYRGSNLVLDYSAEWLCFRLLQLINQLHERVT